MTAWTSSELPDTLRVPGVYGLTRPRATREVLSRTDIAGFVGFECRVRPVRCGVVGVGHEFIVKLAACQVEKDGVPISAEGDEEFELSAGTFGVPVLTGEAVRYALAVVDAEWEDSEADAAASKAPTTDLEEAVEAAKRVRRRRNVVVVAGAAAAAGSESAPDDETVSAAVEEVAKTAWGERDDVAEGRVWARLVDVKVERETADVFVVTVCPAERLVRCDDWRDFVSKLGAPEDDGTFLGRSVRGFFACGGSRCYITTVDRPEFSDADGLALSLRQMLGNEGESEAEATGLERLLLVWDVAILDVPDLYATRVSTPETIEIPPALEDACFRPCTGEETVITALGPAVMGEPLYDEDAVTEMQLDMIARCIKERWRVFLLLCPPITRDDTSGEYGAPGLLDVGEWRDAIHGAVTDGGLGEQEEVSVAGLYYPWLMVQESVGAAELTLPPTGFAAGIMASRDLRRGPAVSPANEPVATAVAPATPVDDDALAALYDPDDDEDGNARPAVNVMHGGAGGGVELWGARTVSTETWLRFISVRRGLSAVQRRCYAALQRTVFEPNTPALWLQATQIVLNVLMGLYRTNAMRGSTPEEAFYVRCDGGLNPPESIAEGKLIVEVGVAIAAPAEFVVFRLGRSEGVVEVLE